MAAAWLSNLDRDCRWFGKYMGIGPVEAALRGGSPRQEELAMAARLRCDHCDAILGSNHIERDRKRFCCADCARAFDRGELKAISPHAHPDPNLAASHGRDGSHGAGP